MFNIDLLELLGYTASLIVLVSLLMSSIIKLRWINLLGSLVFGVYGILIGAWPVALMNFSIAVINMYYIFKIYSARECFKILTINEELDYLKYFMEFHEEEIGKYAAEASFEKHKDKVVFFVLRNMVPAGIFIGHEKEEGKLATDLDFVIPEYRDFKIGKYIYEKRSDYFLKRGYNEIHSVSSNRKHEKYLRKMGFENSPGNLYVKKLDSMD